MSGEPGEPGDPGHSGTLPSNVGLCSDCRFARVQRSERGSEFWRCRLADTDRRFLRYPPLPVDTCDGYVATGPGDSDRDPIAEPDQQT